MIDRIASLSLAGLAVVVLAGCGSSNSSGTGTSALGTSASTSGGPPSVRTIKSAGTERNKLLTLAKPGTSVTSQGTVGGWPPANGSGIPATSTEVSGFGFVVDKAQNIQYLGFTVMDTSGKCAGGVLEANAAGTQITAAKPVTIPAKAPCTGDDASKLAGYSS